MIIIGKVRRTENGSVLVGMLWLLAFCGAFALAGEKPKPSLRKVLPALDVPGMGLALGQEHPLISGDWHDGRTWQGRFCQKSWEYRFHVEARIDKIDLKLNEDTTMTLLADFKDLVGSAEGSWKSNATLCQTVSADTTVRGDHGYLVAKVFFEGEDATLENARIQVQSTQIDRLRLGSWVPDEIEELITRLANRAFENVWTHRLGEWINEYINWKLKQDPISPG